MSYTDFTIHPGPVFYAVWAGLMRAQGDQPTNFAISRGFAPSNFKRLAEASATDKAMQLREEMLDAVDREMFETLYRRRLETMRKSK